ncbi:PPE family protein [Mycobacterium timonense]|uniref:PPE family protein n=1 Tax=Mycobacterium timonense TaxID=701043 RepID=A0A7I9Z1W3_9MYCO|nr:PPE family protein [Mycobacterium timonense]GFG94832.1 PPE family protein [Mycobacterium timonense]
MLDFGALPPEINSTRMYAGPGSAPMVAAAAAWDVLANGLETASRGYTSVITQLEGESWTGSASAAMATAAAPYAAWLATAGAQAEEAAGQARAAAAAYETAFGATVPPALVTANRSLLTQLVATNVLGQNTAMIGATEGAYEEMWAQDAAAMYGYAASSSGATALTQFDEPPRTTNADGQPAQTAAVAQATNNSAASQSHAALSRTMSNVPQQLHNLSETPSPGSTGGGPSTGSALDAVDDFNTLTAPVNLGDAMSRTVTSAGTFGTGAFRANLQAAGEAAKAAVAPAATASLSTGTVGVAGPTLASTGSASAVGRLSVPQSWAATNPAIATVAESHWLSDAELDGGPSWHEGPATNMWGGAPAAGAGASSALLSRPSVNNVLRVAPRQFKMPRPSAGG